MTLAQQQWGGMIDDIQRDNDAREVSKLIRGIEQSAAAWEERAGILERRVLKGESDQMGGFALQAALETFVAKCWPNHPLVHDLVLRGRIFHAGILAGSMECSFSAAREAGRTFSMPAEVMAPALSTRQEISALGEQLLTEQLKSRDLEAQLNAQVAVSQRLIRDCAHHMAQSAAFREQLTHIDPQNPLVVDADLRRRIAEEAYAQLEMNKGVDWNVVREVGKTFKIPERHHAESGHADPIDHDYGWPDHVDPIPVDEPHVLDAQCSGDGAETKGGHIEASETSPPTAI